MGKHTGNVCKTPEQEQYPSGMTCHHVQMDRGLPLLPTPLLSDQTHNKFGRHPPISVPQKNERKKKKRRGTKKPIPVFGSISVTAKTATKIYQNLHKCVLSRFSCVRLCVTLWTVALQAPLSMVLENGQEYLSGLPCSPSGDLLDPGIEPAPPEYPALQAGSSPLSSVQLLSRV